MESTENRIRDERQSRGLTLSELSDASGVSVSSLSRYERGGDVPVSALRRIADAMDTDASSLVKSDPDMACVADLEQQLFCMQEQNVQISQQNDQLRATVARQQSELDLKRAEIVHQQEKLAMYERSARTKNIIIYLLSAILALALAALIIDLCSPNLGWLRAALHMQFLHL
mgnify:FL=1